MLMGGFWAVREGRELHFTFLICSYSLLRFVLYFVAFRARRCCLFWEAIIINCSSACIRLVVHQTYGIVQQYLGSHSIKLINHSCSYCGVALQYVQFWYLSNYIQTTSFKHRTLQQIIIVQPSYANASSATTTTTTARYRHITTR